ncbi:MAG: MotA/TolQ/ExbB proton channel family protein [Elusimicrobiota bacterium]|jgi:biopolymer transport protein ExbB/TolQ|nr:MotA/TolQ/ExbB proton channel family protein [Elusimicrobiota bacterium]
MLNTLSFADILRHGGFAFYLLIIVSIFSAAIILFKLGEFFMKSHLNRHKFTQKITVLIQQGRLNDAVAYCNRSISPMAAVAKAGIIASTIRDANIADSMDREIMIETVRLEKFITIIGTIGSIAVYIGLLGTVIGIIRAFSDIAAAGSGGLSVVIRGVAEALAATAAGLSVSIPAVIAYNFFVKTIDKFAVNMEYCASAVENALSSLMENRR